MKKCPKNCGTFEDYESKCPRCGARLLKIKPDANRVPHPVVYEQNLKPNPIQKEEAFDAPFDDRGYVFDNREKRIGNSGFSYDTHIYGMKEPTSNVPANDYQKRVGQTQSYSPRPTIRRGKGIFRGRVKNLREDNVPMGTGENLLYSMMHGTRLAAGDKTYNFQLIELDEDDNATGVVYSVTFRGEIMIGHFYDGNIVSVDGKRAKTGEIYAKYIFNETTNCAVKFKVNLIPF